MGCVLDGVSGFRGTRMDWLLFLRRELRSNQVVAALGKVRLTSTVRLRLRASAPTSNMSLHRPGYLYT